MNLHNVTGDIDGHTGLITSTDTIHDVYRLRDREYIKVKRILIIFLLVACCNMFFGDSERRTMLIL